MLEMIQELQRALKVSNAQINIALAAFTSLAERADEEGDGATLLIINETLDRMMEANK